MQEEKRKKEKSVSPAMAIKASAGHATVTVRYSTCNEIEAIEAIETKQLNIDFFFFLLPINFLFPSLWVRSLRNLLCNIYFFRGKTMLASISSSPPPPLPPPPPPLPSFPLSIFPLSCQGRLRSAFGEISWGGNWVSREEERQKGRSNKSAIGEKKNFPRQELSRTATCLLLPH